MLRGYEIALSAAKYAEAASRWKGGVNVNVSEIRYQGVGNLRNLYLTILCDLFGMVHLTPFKG